MKTLQLSLFCGIAALSIAVNAAPPKKTPAKKPPVKNETKGQGQLVGANGQFGMIYTLKDNLNFQIITARYTTDSYAAYAPLFPKADEKLVILDVAIKNTRAQDFFTELNFFTLVDEKGELYPNGAVTLDSKGVEALSINLRPGQGMGQPALKDGLHVGFVVPAKARIVKVMVNQGRLGKSEEVLRYFIADATKEEAGEVGDPKNVIKPLADNVRDTSHPSGALALAEGKAKKGEYYSANTALLRFDKLEVSVEAKLDGNPPEEGKAFAIVTMTAKSDWGKEFPLFDVTGDEDCYLLANDENDSFKPINYRKAKSDAVPEHTFKKGDEYVFRVFFSVPKDSKFKKLVFKGNNGRKWAIEGTDLK
ncbi:MAG: hypothetical protein NT023_07340 [Armatimonadetes bacterium]|nr:hypothetical protein [Armatimonadota bacterium]